MLAERAKKSLPDDLTTEGTLRGSLSIQEGASTKSKFRFAGKGEIADFRLSSASNKAEIGPTTVPFVMVDDSAESRRLQSMAKNRGAMALPKGPHVEFGPLALNTGRSATARGWLNRSGYSLGFSGEGEIGRMLRLARTFGISALAATAEGPAQANLQIAGSWIGEGGGSAAGFPPPQVTGTAKLRNVHVTLAGASDPVEIVSSEMQLSSNGVQVTKLNAKAAGATWTGTLEMPRGCGTPESCSIRFALNADEIGLARLSEWVSGRPKTQPWYQVLPSGKAGKPLLARLHASGRVSTNRFLIHGVSATDVSADVTIDAGKVQISELEADLLGGRHRGRWEADFSVSPSVCSGNGTLTGVSLSSVADEMEDDWVAGTAGASYELNGLCTEGFWPSAEGTLRVDVNDGSLPHVLIRNDAEPLKITRLSGQAKLRSGEIELTSAKLNSPNGTYQISGTVSLQREVDLKMTPAPTDTGHTGYEITGTLAEPHVSPLSSPEQARLKPLPAK
jgi:hypothetical protein